MISLSRTWNFFFLKRPVHGESIGHFTKAHQYFQYFNDRMKMARDDVKVKSVLHTIEYYWSVNSTRYTINRSSQENVFFLRFNCSITALNCKGTNLFGISNSLEFVQQMYIIMWLVGWVGKELSPVSYIHVCHYLQRIRYLNRNMVM